MHGFMSTGSFELPNYYSCPSSREEADQEAKQSSFMELQKEEIEIFWNQQLFEIQNTTVAKAHHELPLARVKRVMKSDGEVKKVRSETPVLFSKACELFIMELTLRSWLHTERSNRRTLQHCDTARAIMQDELLHFLVHAVPFDHAHCHKEEEIGKFSQNVDSRTTGALRLRETNQLGGGMGEMNQVLQQYMIDPSMSSAELHRDYFEDDE
ncbi:unnamed protein product [Prunus armeniaca]|uniref:Transcription factor CBF/NF-Y/archaeal histone domain-containing protein n=1 Tax=Prunus armeniaca TaxID=36596 RepID=A0A6J5UBI1_PRUAR|nr:unnamed protein product [Prunus armeniaca]